MLQQFKTAFKEQVWESEQVLKLRQKFSELDTQSQSYILIGTFAGFVLILLLTFFITWGKAISLKNQIAQSEEDIRYLQTSSVKIQELVAQAQSQGSDPLLENMDLAAPVTTFLEQAVQKSQIAKTNAEISEPKGPAVDLKLNKISLNQLVRMLYIIEQSGAGATVEKLSVDARDNLEGYLWATFTVRKLPGGR